MIRRGWARIKPQETLSSDRSSGKPSSKSCAFSRSAGARPPLARNSPAPNDPLGARGGGDHERLARVLRAVRFQPSADHESRAQRKRPAHRPKRFQQKKRPLCLRRGLLPQFSVGYRCPPPWALFGLRRAPAEAALDSAWRWRSAGSRECDRLPRAGVRAPPR